MCLLPAWDTRQVRIAAPGLTFNFLLSMCMNPIRNYGASDLSVTRRAMHFLEDVGCMAPLQIWTEVSQFNVMIIDHV